MKDVYKCASMDTGDECVVMVGILPMVWLCVDSCLERIFVRLTSNDPLQHTTSICFAFAFHIHVVAVPLYIFGRDSGNIMLYNVNCTGSSTRLVDCSYEVVQGSSSGGCTFNLSQDAGVRCYGRLLPWQFCISDKTTKH